MFIYIPFIIKSVQPAQMPVATEKISCPEGARQCHITFYRRRRFLPELLRRQKMWRSPERPTGAERLRFVVRWAERLFIDFFLHFLTPPPLSAGAQDARRRFRSFCNFFKCIIKILNFSRLYFLF